MLSYGWEFSDMVVSNLVVCKFYAEALFCTLLRSFADLRLRSFALICFAPICMSLRPTAVRTTRLGTSDMGVVFYYPY